MPQRLPTYFACALSLAVICVSCKPRQSQQAEADAELAADKREIAALAQRHGGLVGLQTSLQRRGASSPFTYDVTRALTPTNGAPVLSVMSLDDVSESAGIFQATFSHHFIRSGFFRLVLKLDCTPAQAAELLVDDRISPRRSYAIVAKIATVSRPVFTLEGEMSGEDVSVEVRSDGDTFFARGKCIEQVKLRRSHFTFD